MRKDFSLVRPGTASIIHNTGINSKIAAANATTCYKNAHVQNTIDGFHWSRDHKSPLNSSHEKGLKGEINEEERSHRDRSTRRVSCYKRDKIYRKFRC